MKRTMKTIGLTAASTLLLIGCGGGGGDNQESSYGNPYPAPAITETLKNEYLSAVNAARATARTCGEYGSFPPAPALSWSDALYTASYEHSQDMSATGYYSHDGSGTETDWTATTLNLGRGSNNLERVENNGYVGGGYASENIVSSRNSVSSAMSAWLNSPAHCSGIMDGTVTLFGMAEVGGYWTQTFAQ